MIYYILNCLLSFEWILCWYYFSYLVICIQNLSRIIFIIKNKKVWNFTLDYIHIKLAINRYDMRIFIQCFEFLKNRKCTHYKICSINVCLKFLIYFRSWKMWCSCYQSIWSTCIWRYIKYDLFKIFTKT